MTALVLSQLEIASIHGGILARWSLLKCLPGSWHLLVKGETNTAEKPCEMTVWSAHLDGYCVLGWLAGIMIGPAQSTCFVQTWPGSQ